MPSATRAPRRRLHRAAVSAALCPVALLGPVHGAAAGTWSVAPAGAGRPFLYAEGPPGAVLQDTVSVTNPGRTPVVVRLTGTGVRTAFADGRVRVPARTRADVPFAVTVPAGAEPGDLSGTVVARDAGGRTATVRLRLRVAGPALAALTVEHLSVGADGSPTSWSTAVRPSSCRGSRCARTASSAGFWTARRATCPSACARARA